MAILISALLRLLSLLLQHFYKLLDFLGQLHKVLVNRICFLTAFLSGVEIGFLLSVFLRSTTVTSVVHVIHAPMPLAQVAMLLAREILGNPGHRLGTRTFLPFLALMRSFLGRFHFGLLVGADALNGLK